jgi:hypothetical protein
MRIVQRIMLRSYPSDRIRRRVQPPLRSNWPYYLHRICAGQFDEQFEYADEQFTGACTDEHSKIAGCSRTGEVVLPKDARYKLAKRDV